jgi:hypothetical protein
VPVAYVRRMTEPGYRPPGIASPRPGLRCRSERTATGCEAPGVVLPTTTFVLVRVLKCLLAVGSKIDAGVAACEDRFFGRDTPRIIPRGRQIPRYLELSGVR